MQEIPSKHFVGKVAAKAIIAKEDRVLISLGYAQNGNTLWDLPGGRVHQGEKPDDAVGREVIEELGVPIRLRSVVFMEQFLHAEGPTLLIVYEAELKSPELPFALPTDEVDEVRWITKEELLNQTIYPVCLHALEAYFNKKTTT
ncbi:MAG: NUDIX hydrolase [Patescibacteria group bacterium]